MPAYDVSETVSFYVTQLGCKLVRRYDDRVTLDFFGDQLVCHLTPGPSDPTDVAELSMYPRALRRDLSRGGPTATRCTDCSNSVLCRSYTR